MLDENIFIKNGVGAIEICNRTNDENEENYIKYELYDVDGKLMRDIRYRNNFEPVDRLSLLFGGLYGYALENISEELLQKNRYIELTECADERIFSLLLSKELKTVFDYNTMKSTLSDNECGVIKDKSKLKI
jgi:hypothetical protein